MKFDINQLGSIASIIVGIPTIIFWIFKGLNNVIRYKLSRNVKDGIYRGYWIDPQNNRINCEILQLKKTYNGFRAQPLYMHPSSHEYTLKASPFSENKFIFAGNWKTNKKSIYMGPALFQFDDDANKLSGKWLGPRSNGIINGGDWILEYYKTEKNSYLKSKVRKKLEIGSEKFFSEKSIIEDIILKHNRYFKTNNKISIDKIELQLNRESFNPQLGKISIPLIKYAVNIVDKDSFVLDLGTGTGFYPIYLGVEKKCRSIGVDITSNILNLARNNAYTNNVDSLIEFRKCKKNDLFSSVEQKERFDFIIANLPFSKISKTIKSRNSDLFFAFSGNPQLLEQLILGSQFHIKPNGKLIFCYGESGYKDLLESLVELSSWNYLKIVDFIESKDEKFYIYELELKDYVKDKYKQMNFT